MPVITIACSLAPKIQDLDAELELSEPSDQTASPRSEVVPITTVSNLSLDAALELCDKGHPRLQEMKARLQGAEGQILQAGLLPNPSLVARVEQIPLRGSADKFIQPILGISQDISIGGRLSRAENLAKKEQAKAQQALEVERRELHRKVRGRFATALYMTRVAELKRSTRSLMDELVRISELRVKAGDNSPDDLARAELETLRIEVETARIENLRRRAMIDLASALGNPNLSIKGLSGHLEERLEIGRAKWLLKQLDKTRELRLADAEIESHEARVALIESERVPDISVDLFYRRLEDDNIDSIDFGVRIPLGIFDRRQGDLITARAKVDEGRSRRKRIRAQLESRIKKAGLSLRNALARSTLLRDKVLPRAKTLLSSAKIRFEAGDIGLSELLIRRREDVSLQVSYLESLREVMVAWVEISSFATKG